jgi:hypothetical protein
MNVPHFDSSDAYRAALVSLAHTPIRFLPAAINEVAARYERTRGAVEEDLHAYVQEARNA